MEPSLTLPDGRALTLADDVVAHLETGVIVVEGVVVRSEPAVWEETTLLSVKLRELHAGRKPAEIAGLRAARDLYHAFGMEPTRYRPSSEALLRRVLKNQDLYHVNNVVDCANLASLSFLLPLGLYDLDRVEGDIVLRLGRNGEQYPGIRKDDIHLENRLGLFDAAGPFGSPTSDSARTSIGDAARRVLAVVMATRLYPSDQMRGHLALLGDLFARYCGGRTIFDEVLGFA